MGAHEPEPRGLGAMTAQQCAGSPLISVVVPTFNRLLRLKRVLAALADQTVPGDRYEVIVVSDGSTDGTDEYLASAPYPIVVAVQPNAGPAAARNRGAELARAELILFVDDDVIASRDLVEQHLASHSAVGGPELVVIGPMLNPPDFKMSSWIRWEQAMLYKQYGAMERGLFKPTFRQFYTGNASLPRARCSPSEASTRSIAGRRTSSWRSGWLPTSASSRSTPRRSVITTRNAASAPGRRTRTTMA